MLNIDHSRNTLAKVFLICVSALALVLVTYEFTRLTISPTTYTRTTTITIEETITVLTPELVRWTIPITFPIEAEGVVDLWEPYWFMVKSIDKTETDVYEFREVNFTWRSVTRFYEFNMTFPDGWTETIRIGWGTVSPEDPPWTPYAYLRSHGEWRAGEAWNLSWDRLILLVSQGDKGYIHLETGRCGKTQIDDTFFHFTVLNQSYYTIWGYSNPSTVKFHGVRFVFPPDQLIGSAGPQIEVNITFPDGREESFIGRIIGPKQTSVRLLTEAKNPQAGVELNTDGEIRLLVSET